MRKYLNENVFFQGDSKIVTILIALFILLWSLLEFTIHNTFYTYYEYIIYDNSGNGYTNSPLGRCVIIILLVFLIISFTLICGMFKRKKWSTLLSCTFTRIDIRKRELTLMGGCIIGFILIFLLVCIRYSIKNDILVSYIDGFWALIGMDVIRIIIVSAAITAVLFFIDSLTSNMYVTLGLLFSIGLYFLAITITLANSFLWTYNSIRLSVINFITDVLQSILVGEKSYVYSYKFLIGLIILVLLTIICGVITKKLTKKIRIEHMGDALIFINIRNMIPFFLSTLIGMGAGTTIFQILLWNSRFELALNSITYPIVSFGIIIIISVISNIIIKCSIKAFKNKIPKKYI